jgi:hypothetical protein
MRTSGGGVRCFKGTGRYAVSLGAIAAATSIGASLSNLIAGYVVNATSYAGGFIFLAMVAVLTLLVFYFGVGETRQDAEPTSSGGQVAGRTPTPTEASSRRA